MTGPINPHQLINELEKQAWLLQPPPTLPLQIKNKIPSTQQDIKFNTKRVPFPSADEDVGSIAYGFKCPVSGDVRILLALEVLLRYLCDTQASILSQTFIEIASPYASDVDYEVKPFMEGTFVLCFSGIPHLETDSSEAISLGNDSNDGDVSEVDSLSLDSVENDYTDSSSEKDEKTDLFAEGVFHRILKKCFVDFLESGFMDNFGIQSTLNRHRLKIQEAMEEDSHEVITNLLIPEVVTYFLDAEVENRKNVLGSRTKVFEMLNDLAKEPQSFWSHLFRTWIVDASIYEIRMIPSRKLAKEIELKESIEQSGRVKALGNLKLAAHVDAALHACNENQIIFTNEMYDSFPRIPDASIAPSLKCIMDPVIMNDERCPFREYLIIHTDTRFVHSAFAFDIANLEFLHRDYLVLFQELLFQSPLRIPSGNGVIIMEYQEVVKYSSQLFISHEAGVGLKYY